MSDKQHQETKSSKAHTDGGGAHEAGGGGEHGQAGAAVSRMAGGGHVEDVGEFDQTNKPGPRMAGKTFPLKPGDSLRLTAEENQIYGLIDIKSDNPAVTVGKKLVKAMHKGELGNTNTYQYTITMGHDAHPGTSATLSTEAPYQSRGDHGWVFNFKVKSA